MGPSWARRGAVTANGDNLRSAGGSAPPRAGPPAFAPRGAPAAAVCRAGTQKKNRPTPSAQTALGRETAAQKLPLSRKHPECGRLESALLAGQVTRPCSHSPLALCAAAIVCASQPASPYSPSEQCALSPGPLQIVQVSAGVALSDTMMNAASRCPRSDPINLFICCPPTEHRDVRVYSALTEK